MLKLWLFTAVAGLVLKVFMMTISLDIIRELLVTENN